MHRITAAIGAVALLAATAAAQPAAGPYRILKTARVGGLGGWDYVYADADGRRLYIPRSGQGARITVFDLDTLAPAGEIPNVNAHGVAVDARSGHGFSSSRPVVMFDTKTLNVIKTIDVQGNPDGIMFDPFNERVWILSHTAPHATVIDGKDGSIVGTIDLGGAPEQAQSDGNGRLYVDIEDKDTVAIVDTKTLTVTGTYDLSPKAKTPAGLALDAKNHVLFAACRNAPTMVILNAQTGGIITSLPIGTGVDGAGFNPATLEAFSSQGDGTLTIIKENSPTSFEVEQNLQTMDGARTIAFDSKTDHILTMSQERGPAPPPPPGGGRGPRAPVVPGSFTILMIGR